MLTLAVLVTVLVTLGGLRSATVHDLAAVQWPTAMLTQDGPWLASAPIGAGLWLWSCSLSPGVLAAWGSCLGIGLATAALAGGAGLPYGAPAKLRVIAQPHGRSRPRRRSCRVSHP